MDRQPEPTLAELIRYNNWANAQVLAACQSLDADQLAAAAPGAYGTIRDTLAHIIRAEASYASRLTGGAARRARRLLCPALRPEPQAAALHP